MFSKAIRNHEWGFVVTMAALSVTASAFAHPPERPRTIDQLMVDADLVFQGEVVDIAYALSQPTGPEGSRIAHTFVTYRIENLLHGSAEEELITLRFMGGLNRETERYMTICCAPQFDIGDEDVLFVKDNGQAIVPLVSNQQGRLRIIDEQVYTEEGRSVALDRDGLILQGDRYLLDDVMTTNVQGHIFSIQFGPDAIEGRSGAMTFDELIERIQASALSAPAPQRGFVSASAEEPFDGPDYTPAAPVVRPHDLEQPEQDPEGEGAPGFGDGSEIIRQRKGQ